MDALHRGEIDHKSAFCDVRAGDVMAAASHRGHEISFPGSDHRVDDVGTVAAARDQRWTLVDQTVVDLARRVVAGVAGRQDDTGETLGERSWEVDGRHDRHRTPEPAGGKA